MVFGLAANEASGPDGLSHEFIQKYWPALKHTIMLLMHQFYTHELDLSGINISNVVMIPKNDAPTTCADYRPIRIINLLPKLISKVLANRPRT